MTGIFLLLLLALPLSSAAQEWSEDYFYDSGEYQTYETSNEPLLWHSGLFDEQYEFRPFESLVEPFFYASDETPPFLRDERVIFETPAAPSIPDEDGWFEFYRVDERSWTEQAAEDSRESERAHPEVIYEPENAKPLWYTARIDELTPADVRELQQQTMRDRLERAPVSEPVPLGKQIADFFEWFRSQGTDAVSPQDVTPEHEASQQEILPEIVMQVEDAAPILQPSVQNSAWGFTITEEERAAAAAPPPYPQWATPVEKNEIYYSWLFTNKVPFTAKEWSNQALEFFRLR